MQDDKSPTADVATVEDAASGKRALTLSGRSGERYRLGVEIGHGGMGEIMTATDEQIGREVAVKRLKQRNPTEHAMGRFFREACIQGRLDHPAIVPVHELGVDDDGRPFFTMKKLTGTTLAARIADGYSRQRLLRAFADVCLAIEFAHARGVVHRDIKPQNIVLGDFGEVYVLDWGIAKLVDEPDVPADDPLPAIGQTAVGAAIGTRAYMAPEQARAEPIDGRADVYSLGCVLFEILTGEQRYSRDYRETRPSLRAPGREIPPELDALCVAATEADRAVRIQTPRELGEQIERFLDGDRDLALRRQLAQAHLDAARTAFAAGDGEPERRTAMREAGRALALDPKLSGAGELVSRLMLEPPRERPPEVQRMIEADDLETLRRMSRAGAYGYLGYLSLLPAIIAGGSEHLGYAAALCALITFNCTMLLRGFDNLRARAVRVAAGNAAMLLLVSHMASPFLLAPAIAAVVTTTSAFSPTFYRPRAGVILGALYISAVLLPWFAELAGLIEPTVRITATGIELTPVMLAISPIARQVLLGLFVVGVLSAAAGMALANRRTERSVRDRLQLQAWQLRQLVA